jgi:flagella basal body P-ring formation protein FlgA
MLRFLACLIALLAATAPGAAAVLRPSAVVEDDVVRLGDLFDGAGKRANDIVAPAPQPGFHAVYDAGWLANVAQAHGLDWQPGSSLARAVVERASRTIDASAIADAMSRALAKEGRLGDAVFKLDNPKLHLVVAADAPACVSVTGLTVDPGTGRVTAMVAAPPHDRDAEQMRVTGRIRDMVELPVLAHFVAPGQTIAAIDLERLSVPSARVAPGLIVDPDGLVGKTPRRALRPHRPVRRNDVEIPLVVHRGDLVTIVLETPALRLTAQGKAAEDGGLGAPIRVANTTSGRVLEAVVTAPGLVSLVRPGEGERR